MPDAHENSVGIPMTPNGIPEGSIPSPFPYLNPDSDEWKGADEEGGFDTDGGVAVRRPVDPDDFGGDEAEEDYDDEDDFDDDDSDTGFGVGAFLGSFFAPPPLLPA